MNKILYHLRRTGRGANSACLSTRFIVMLTALLLSVFVAGNNIVSAQISTAELRGLVTDQADAAIPGAKVVLTDTSKGTTRTATTEADGSYLFLNLLPGAYEIRVEATSFAPYRTSVTLTVGQQANIPIKLTPGQVEITVDVVAGAAVVETERTQQSSVVDTRQIQNLPISRRNYLDYALLTPGVVDSDNIADASDFRVAQTPQSGLSFGGNNGRGNAVSLDGADVTGSSGAARGTISQEGVQEFQVQRNSYSAEFGGASGGSINIISKTGGNGFHGSLFGFFRNQRFDARNPFDFNPNKRISDFDRQQFGGSLGGPLKQDKTFFFTAVERFNQGETTFVNLLNDPTIFQPTAGQTTLFDFLGGTPFAAAATGLRAALTTTATAYPRTINLFNQATGQFPFDSNQTQGMLRLDHVFNDHSSGYLRFDITDSKFENQAAGALTAVSRGRAIDTLGGDLLASHNFQFTPTFFNELKLQFGWQRFGVIPNDPNGPEINIEGFGNFGRDIFLPSTTITRHYDIADNLTKIAGSHTIKFGTYINLINVFSNSETFFPARFNFGTAIPLSSVAQPALGATAFGQLNAFLRGCNASPASPGCNATGAALGADANANGVADALDAPINALQSFNLNLPIVYQQGFGDPLAKSWTNRNSFYVQDTWKMAPGFTFNYGLRYYIAEEPFFLPTYKGDFQPRAGFSWDVGGKGKTVVRAGAGIFVGPINNAVANVTTELSGRGDPGNINIVIATPTTSAFGLPTSFAVYQTLLARGVLGNRPIVLSDVSGAPLNINPRAGAPLEVRFREEANYRSPTTYQASLGIQQNLGGGFSLETSYLFARGIYLTRNRDINQFKRTGPINPLNPNGGATFIRFPSAAQVQAGLSSDFRNPLRFQDNVYEASASSFYHAGTVQVTRLFSRRFVFNAHYTLSRAIDEVTDFNSDFSAQNPLNLSLDRALSAFDQRHRFVISGVLSGPPSGDTAASKFFGDWQLSPIFIAGSGRPFNLLLGFDANGDGRSQSDRPGLAGRNTGTGENFYSFDLRLSRRFAVQEQRFFEITLEGFNLFNRTNLTGINNAVGTTFATATDFNVRGRTDRAPTQPLGFTSAADARKMQFGVRFNF